MAGVQGRSQRSQGRRQQERRTTGARPLASVVCVAAGLGPAAAAADNTVRIRRLVRQFKFGRRGEGEWRVEPGWKGQRARMLCRRSGFFALRRAAVAAALHGVVVVVIIFVVAAAKAAVAGGCGIDVVRRRPCRGVPAMFTLVSVTVLLLLLLLLVLVLSAMLLLVNNRRKSSEHKHIRVRSDQGSD
jgi:hypothetical protein